jgi:hypothetical protein
VQWLGGIAAAGAGLRVRGRRPSIGAFPRSGKIQWKVISVRKRVMAQMEICRSKVKNSFDVVVIIISIIIIIVFIILISISLFPLRGVKPGNDNFHLFQRWLCKYCRHAKRGIT